MGKEFWVYIMASKRNGTWKIELIENSNPEWRDLYEEINA